MEQSVEPKREEERSTSPVSLKMSINCHGEIIKRDLTIQQNMLNSIERILKNRFVDTKPPTFLDQYKVYFNEKLRALISSNSSQPTTFLSKFIVNIMGECSLLINEISLSNLVGYINETLGLEFHEENFRIFLKKYEIVLVDSEELRGGVFSGSHFLQVFFERMSKDEYDDILAFLDPNFLPHYKTRYGFKIDNPTLFVGRANFQKVLLREIMIYFVGTINITHTGSAPELVTFDEVFSQQFPLSKLGDRSSGQGKRHEPEHNLFYQIQDLNNLFDSPDLKLKMYDKDAFFCLNEKGQFTYRVPGINSYWSNLYGTRLGILASVFDETPDVFDEALGVSSKTLVDSPPVTETVGIFQSMSKSIGNFFSKKRKTQPEAPPPYPQVLSEPERQYSLLDRNSETRTFLERHIKSLYPSYPRIPAGELTISGANILIINDILDKFDRAFSYKKRWEEYRVDEYFQHEPINYSDILLLSLLLELKTNLEVSCCLYTDGRLTRSLKNVGVVPSLPNTQEPYSEEPPSKRRGGSKKTRKKRRILKKKRRKTK